MTKWLKKLWFKLTYDEIAMKCRRPLGKSLFIFVLMSGICSAQTSILTYDANGVTRLHARLNAPAIDIPIPPVNPPGTTFIGIPEPRWWTDANAFDVSYRMYDSNDKQVAARVITPTLVYRVSDSGGYYTHYVDGNSPNRVYPGDGYGSPEAPLSRVPSPLPAGSIVEIHNTSLGTAVQKRIKCLGTQDLPIFIRGVDDPILITDGFRIRGYWAIIEGVTFHVGTLSIGLSDTDSTFYDRHHIVFRDNLLYADGVVGSRSGMSASGGSIKDCNNVVFYNNVVHHGGDSESATENDNHGITIGSYINRVWIINNHIYNMGGDSVQLCHGANFTSHHVYIGGNKFHDDRENAVDIKQCNDVVVSQNVFYGYEPSSSSEGGACVVHYDPNRIWWMFNTIYDSTYGIVSTGCSNQYVIGNIIFDISGSGTPSTPYSPHRQGIGIRWYNTRRTYVIANTIYDCLTGVGADILSHPTTIVNNVISQRESISNGYHMTIQGKGLADSVVENNLFYQTGELSKIYWGGTYNGVAAFQAGTGKGAGCLETDPLFEDPANGDFTISAESPILSMSLSSQIDTISNTFYSLYEIRIDGYIKDLFTDGIIYAPNAE